MFLFNKSNYKKMQLFMVSLLIAFVVILNFYMLNKVISNSSTDRNNDRDYDRNMERNIIINR